MSICSTWIDLELKGWEKKEQIEKGQKRTVYKTPMVNGIRRTIQRSRDLKPDEKKYANILFPKSSTSKAQLPTQTEVQNESNIIKHQVQLGQVHT